MEEFRYVYVLTNSEGWYTSGVVDDPTEIPKLEGYFVAFVSDPIEKGFNEDPFHAKSMYGVCTLDKCLLIASQYASTCKTMANALQIPHHVVLNTIHGNLEKINEWNGYYGDDIDPQDYYVDMGTYKNVHRGFYLTEAGRTVLRRQLGGFFHCIDKEY